MKSQSLLLILFCFLCLNLSAQNKPDINLKFGKGLSIIAADSSMKVKMNFRFQSLLNAERTLAEGEDWSHAFMIRRARLKFGGWAMNPNLKYKVELALSNRDLGSKNDYAETNLAPKIILDAVVKWRFHKNFEVWAGQTKLPGNRERVISSQKLQLVDRSLVNSIFNIDREMGIHLHSKFQFGQSVIKPIVAVSFGEGRNITKTNLGGFNYTARLEWLPFGEFKSKGDYFSSDLKREPKPKLAFGASYNRNQGDSRQKKTGRFLVDAEGNPLKNDLQTVFVDMMFKYRGFSVLSEFAHKEVIVKNPEDSRDNILDAEGRSYHTGNGFTVQGGYLFKKNIELAGRYTIVTPDSDVSFNGIKEYTLGISKYIVGHSLKLQGDMSLIDEVGAANKDLRYRMQMEFQF